MSYVFLYRIKDSNDRDCCAYIENKPMRFECSHYFGSVVLHGSCYCNHEFANYDDIETVLSREEYHALIDFSNAIEQLGFGIKMYDERYKKGVQLCESIQYVYDKLNSEAGQEFFRTIQESEKEFLMNEYNLTDEQVEDIFDNYSCVYRDRSIVSCVFQDAYECGHEEAYNFGYVNINDHIKYIMERYFDFERFGEDLCEDENYHQLDDGRVVYLNY